MKLVVKKNDLERQIVYINLDPSKKRRQMRFLTKFDGRHFL